MSETEDANRADGDDAFGVCPYCLKTNGYISIGRSHWFYCSEHKVCWLVGSNLFSWPFDESWEEMIAAQERTYDRLDFGSFRMIHEYHPDEMSFAERQQRIQ